MEYQTEPNGIKRNRLERHTEHYGTPARRLSRSEFHNTLCISAVMKWNKMEQNKERNGTQLLGLIYLSLQTINY